jgi:N-sulfoglucosamine sulfohydrolase
MLSEEFMRMSPLMIAARSLVTASLLALPLPGLAADSPNPELRPNIVLIISEDHGPDLGCYGDPYVKTPHLDQFAKEGVRFQNAYVTQAGCSQSRASILTGLYPHQHGQLGLATWGFRLYRDDTPNIPRSLKAAGYRTGIIGKLHINPESAFPYDVAEMPSGNFARRNLGDYARHAEAFFKAGSQPFFLHINYPEAHDPFLTQVDGLPTEPLTGKDVRSLPHLGIDPPELRQIVADYYNCISRLDSLVGDLLTALDRSGKAHNTLVIYLSDHGADLLRGKRSCYEGGTRVPLLIRWPGKAKAQVRSELVSTIDLMPTLLAVSGATPVPNLPGRSLVPLLDGKKPAWRDQLFTEFHTHAARANFFPQRAVRNDRHKLIENLLPDEANPDMEKIDKEFPFVPAALAAAPAQVRAAYHLQQRPPRYELYDLRDDPYEFRNLTASAEHAAVFADLKQRLLAWREQTQDPLLNPTNLARLKAEVYAVDGKADAKAMDWGYPDYFFGREPAVQRDTSPATEKPAKKKKKKQQTE